MRFGIRVIGMLSDQPFLDRLSPCYSFASECYISNDSCCETSSSWSFGMHYSDSWRIGRLASELDF